MSRLKNYASAIGSSYVALLANIIHTLASVPLALNYLSKAEFALWGVTTQIAGYVALIDFGMAGVSRILIDHKDSKNGSEYGSVIQTSMLVSLVQAVLILACGMGLAVILAPILRVPAELKPEFGLLIVGQCVFLAAHFLTRTFSYLLFAHQRQDIINYSQALGFAVHLGVLWLGLEFGWGVVSILWSQFCGWFLGAIIAVVSSFRLRVFPHRGCWGRPTWGHFRALFAYGRDIFLFVLGSQLINASQTVLITRELGLETAAIWVICTRAYTLVSQLVFRIFDQSCPALAEMIVRGESERLLNRFKSISILSASCSVVTGVIFAICNQLFVKIWTNGEAGWSPINDSLLACWLVISVLARCHVGLVGQTKNFGFLRYLYLFEGLWFVSLSLWLLRAGGVTAMLVVGLLGTLLFSFPYGTWRTSRFFRRSWEEVALSWSWPPLRLAALYIPAGIFIWWLARPLAPMMRLFVAGGVLGAVGCLLLFYLGLERDLRLELLTRWQVWRNSKRRI